MEYTINRLAKLAGISTRTLRYYDEIGLLISKRISSNGYRIYGEQEVNQFQQILFYKERGIPLEEIKKTITSENFNVFSALESHLNMLLKKRDQLDKLINNVEKTMQAMKGEITMSDKEKFEGFLKELVKDNEKKYGKEIREKYEEEKVNAANAKLLKMSKEQYAALQNLTQEFNKTLKGATEEGDPASEKAQKVCELHKKWLCYFWSDYSKEAHIGITQMYVEDPRFSAYYEAIAPGYAAFLRDAV